MKWSIVLIVLILGALTTSCKIVRHDAQDKQDNGDIAIFFADSAFDPKQFVQEIWVPKVMPYLENRAVDIGVLLDGIKKSDQEICKSGYKVGHEGSFYNFCAKGKVRILSVNTESRNGLAYLDVYPYDNKEDCILQIGPVIKGSSIRDILDFISLNSFANQVEFAKLATELNYYVRDNVLANIDIAALKGREYELTAVFTYEETGELITLTPVFIKCVGD